MAANKTPFYKVFRPLAIASDRTQSFKRVDSRGRSLCLPLFVSSQPLESSALYSRPAALATAAWLGAKSALTPSKLTPLTPPSRDLS